MLQALPDAEVGRLSRLEEDGQSWKGGAAKAKGGLRPKISTWFLALGIRSPFCREPVHGGVCESLRDLTEVPLGETSCLRSHPRAPWHHPAGPSVSLIFSLVVVSGAWSGPRGFELLRQSLGCGMGTPRSHGAAFLRPIPTRPRRAALVLDYWGDPALESLSHCPPFMVLP